MQLGRAAEVVTLQCALGAAQLILDGARFMIEGVAYNLAMAAITAAEGALASANHLWSGLIAAAQRALDGVGAVHAGFIEAARVGVLSAEKIALGIKEAAAAAKDKLLAIHEGILKSARAVVRAVAEGIDFIAFQMALKALDTYCPKGYDLGGHCGSCA